MKRIPSVVLVGRMNVGKSTLFNRIAPNAKSMALDYKGVTRDVISDTVSWNGRQFELVDTGGLEFKSTSEHIRSKVQSHALEAVSNAHIAVFIVDGSVGLMPDDRMIMRHLHTLRKPVVVAINKMDVKHASEDMHEFMALGADEYVGISAEHSRGFEDLLSAILAHLPAQESGDVAEEPRCSVVLLGRPNVGKSSLMNTLAQRERSIVSDEPGTTRDAVSEHIRFYKEVIEVIDTPGIRRKSAVHGELEENMVHCSLQTVESSDIVLLLVDASEGAIVDQELKLGFYAFTERYKALIILVNKSDLADEQSEKALEICMDRYEHLLRKVPVLHISCKTGKNVGKVLPLIHEVSERYHTRIPQEELQRLLVSALIERPLVRNEQKLIIHYAEQVKAAPMTIAMKVNESAWFGESQLAFFENVLRAHYDLRGVPVKFIVRKGQVN